MKAECSKRKCFKCGVIGHKAYQCGAKVDDKKDVKESRTVVEVWKGKYAKSVMMNGRMVYALIDTGSDLILLRKSEYERLGSPDFVGEKLCFKGIGSRLIQSLGEVEVRFKLGEHNFVTRAQVVSDELLKGEKLLGANFLQTVETKNAGQEVVSINPLPENERREWDVTTKVCKIDVEELVREVPTN